jgi:hypothetical protein
MNYDGEVWPCCVLGGTQPLGRVQESGYDIQALLRSSQASATRRYIAEGNCACPLANQWLNNVLLTPRHMLAVLYTYLVRFNLPRPQDVTPAKPAGKSLPVYVKVVGHKPRKALIVQKFGTIPTEAVVDLPELEEAR